MIKVKVGDVVRVVFLDHCTKNGATERGPICFEAFGRIVSIVKKECISLASWIQPDGTIDENTDIYEILIPAIKTIEKLGR